MITSMQGCVMIVIFKDIWPWIHYKNSTTFFLIMKQMCSSPVFTIIFPLAMSSLNMYNNISQILLPYKTWRYYNKFESMKSFGVCY